MVIYVVLSALKLSQYLSRVSMSGSPLSPKFPTVALQQSMSSAYVRGRMGRIETPGTTTCQAVYLPIYKYRFQMFGEYDAALSAAPNPFLCTFYLNKICF